VSPLEHKKNVLNFGIHSLFIETGMLKK